MIAGRDTELKTLDHSTDSLWQVLLNDIRHGKYKQSSKLPPETELATELGISRTQLRDGLALLEQNGFITRRRGIGTAINRNVVDVKTRLDIEVEFLHMIQNIGCEAAMQLLTVDIKTANRSTADKLGVPPNTPILTTSKIVTADGKPVIFCIDHIPFSKIVDYSYTTEELELPIFYFIEKYCHTSVFMDLTEIKITPADALIGKFLEIPEGTPLLHMDEVAYSIDNDPIMYSEEYYINGVFKHIVLRKKI